MRINDDGNIVEIDVQGNTKYDFVYEIEDVLMKHRREIEFGAISEKTLSEILRSITDYEQERFRECKRYLWNIYDVLIGARYCSGLDLMDTSEIGRLSASIAILQAKQMSDGQRNFVNFNKACYEVYFEFAQKSMYKDILSQDIVHMEDVFKPEHIIDIDFCIAYIKTWSVTADEEYTKMLDNMCWRVASDGYI